jgi:diguanylate cyclase (GGDEF)-like protein
MFAWSTVARPLQRCASIEEEPTVPLVPCKKDNLKSCSNLVAQVVRLEKQNARLKRSVARLRVFRTMAYRDPLTGLWNRRYFEERLKEELSRCTRARAGRCFSVVAVDINGFKDINDQHGHVMGDALLGWVGAFLSTHLRPHDVPCRTGGDEFMLLLPDVSATDAALVVDRLRAQLTRANIGRTVPVSLSIGSASWPEASKTCEMIIAKADAAMYEDKRAQRRGLPPADYCRAA